MRRIGIVFLLFGGFALAGLVALYAAYSPAYLAPALKQAVASATGREVVLQSGPRLKLWPHLRIVIKGIKILNPPGMSEPIFAEAPQLDVEIAASALLHRKVEVAEFRLIQPHLSLSIDKNGQANWAFAQPDGSLQPLPADPSARSAVAPIYVEDGSLDFRDERTGAAYNFQHLDLVLNVGSAFGPLDVKGSGEWRKDRVSFSLYVKSPQAMAQGGSPIDLNVSASRLNLAYSGLAQVRDGLELAGQVEARARSLRELLRWVGFPMEEGRGLGGVAATGSLATQGAVLDFKKTRFALDGQNAQGDLKIDASGAQLKIIARLGIDAIDLNQYVPPRDNDTFDLSAPGIEAWSVVPMDFSSLRNVDVEATIAAGRLSYGDVSTSDLNVEATIKDGTLEAQLNSITLYGGKANGDILVSENQGEPGIRATFEGQGIDAKRLLHDFAKFDHIDGHADITLSVEASGRNQQELVGALKGQAGFTFADGTVRGVDADKLLRGVSQGVLTGWQQAANNQTPFKELKANFSLSDGIADNKDFELTGPRIHIAGGGSIDILKREIDFKVEPQALSDTDATAPSWAGQLPVPVIVRGAWSNPKIYPDIAGILENPAAAYRALKSLSSTGKPQPNSALVKPVNASEQKNRPLPDPAVSPSGSDSQTPNALDLLKQQFNGSGDVLNGFSSGSSDP